MRQQISWGILATTTVLSLALITSADTLSDQIHDAAARQQTVRQQTQQVGQQLDALIAEFKANGLADGSDFKTLVAVRAVLDKLSDREMAGVISLLQTAAAQDPAEAMHTAVAAHSGQGNIVVQLQAILNEYQREQALLELASRFGKLAERQQSNLDAAVQTARSTSGHAAALKDPTVRDALDVQQTDQSTLQSDVGAAVNDLNSLAAQASQDDAPLLKKAQDTVTTGQLVDHVSAAAQALKDVLLNSAAGEEKAAHDSLRLIARILGMPQDKLSQLRNAEKEIDEQIGNQQQLADATGKSPMDPQSAQDLESKQGDVVGNTDLTRQDLDKLSPTAADAMKQAEDKMQNARAALKNADKDAAAVAQKDATDQLKQARQSVADQIEKEEAAQNNQKDSLAKLQNLKDQLHQLKEQQEALKQQSAGAFDANSRKDAAQKQADLEKKTKDLQQQAADASPGAAKQLGDAAKNMDQAQQALSDPNAATPAGAAQPQQDAGDQLAQAQQALDQQLAQLQQQADEEKQLEALAQKVADLIVRQIKLEDQTSAAAAKANTTLDNLVSDQAKLSADTDQLRQQLPADAADTAGAALGDARTSMDDATGKLTAKDPQSAEQPQKDAVADLYKALAFTNQKAQEDQQALGQQPDPWAQLAELAQELEQTEDQLAKAQQALTQQPDQSAAQLGKLAEQVGALAAGQAAQQPGQEAQQALQQAQQALSNAAAQAAAGQAQAAADSVAQAQGAIAQAQATLGMAQSMASAEPGQGQGAPGSGPPDGTPAPGSDPGNGAGQGDENNAGQGDGNREPGGHGVVDMGHDQRAVTAGGKYIGLPPRDRQALTQSEREKYPQAYGNMVEGYLTNLSDDDSGKK